MKTLLIDNSLSGDIKNPRNVLEGEGGLWTASRFATKSTFPKMLRFTKNYCNEKLYKYSNIHKYINKINREAAKIKRMQTIYSIRLYQ